MIKSSEKHLMMRWLFNWGPAILTMGLIFIASSTSGSDIPDFGVMNPLFMNGGHFVGYALLGAAFLHALNRQGSLGRSRFLTAGVLVVLYAISDEWHQSFTPDRHPSLTDIFIDTAGGYLGISCLYFIRKRITHPGGRN